MNGPRGIVKSCAPAPEAPVAAGLSPPRSRSWLLALGFAALALVIYAPGLGAPFLSDDFLYLHHNEILKLPLVRAPARILLEPYFANWSPLHELWLLITWKLFGDHPVPHRVANVLLHAGVALALVAAARRAGVGRRASVAAGALLLVHPVAVEAVEWINQSKTLLGTGLALVALERWLAHLREPRRARVVAASLAGVAALLSKPSALPLVVVLGAAVWTHGRTGVRRRALSDLVPLGVATLVTAALNLQAQATQGGVAPWFGGSPAATAEILPWIAWRYVRLVVAPLGLVHGVHPAAIRDLGDPRLWGPLAALAATAAAVVAACRGHRERWLGPAWFAAMLAPVIQIVPMINLFADRYLYAALPGALLLAAQLGEALARRGRAAARALAAAALAAGLLLAGLTALQARRWTDPESLYRTAAEAYPLGRQGWTGLGAVRHQKGDLVGAADAYLHSLAVFPGDGHVRHLLGRVRLQQGDRGRALYDLETSLRLAPNHPDAPWTRRVVERLRRRGVRPVEDAPAATPTGTPSREPPS